MDPEILRLLGRDDAIVVAFSPDGAEMMPVPADLADHGATELPTRPPLEHFEELSRAAAVGVFQQARRTGNGATSVKLDRDDTLRRLDIFNLEASHACFLGVITVAVEELTGESALMQLIPRQSTFTMSLTGVVESVTSAYTAMFGWTADQIVGRSSLDYIHPDDHEDALKSWATMLELPGAAARVRQRFRHLDGHWIWCEVTDVNHLSDPERACVTAEAVDISLELEAQQALQRRETLLDRLRQALPTGVLQIDETGAPAVWNDRWNDLTGVDGATGVAGVVSVLQDRVGFDRALRLARDRGIDQDLAVELSGDGICRFGELHMRPLREKGECFGVLITLDDVTRLRAHQLELADQTRRDNLTGLYNRFGIEEILGRQLARNGAPCAVLFIDLDGFKSINDEFGHHTGDAVLRSVATTVGELIRPEDALGRIGGDEFVVVLDGPVGHGTANVIAERIEMAASVVTAQFSESLRCGFSIGLAMAKADDDVIGILRRADRAMYEDKRHRKQLGGGWR